MHVDTDTHTHTLCACNYFLSVIKPKQQKSTYKNHHSSNLSFNRRGNKLSMGALALHIKGRVCLGPFNCLEQPCKQLTQLPRAAM